MRSTSLLIASLLAATAPVPATAQIRASINLGPIRIGAHIPIVDHYRNVRYVEVRPYSPQRYGDWRSSARYWRPVTVYVLNGRYYERPYRNARRVVVYRYRNQYFRAPGGRDWDRSRARLEREYWGGDRRDDRYDRRDDRRGDRADRRDDRRDDRPGNRGNGRGGGRGAGRN